MTILLNCRKACCLVAAAAFAAPLAQAVNIVGDANAETIISPSNTVIRMTQDGTLTVTEPGEIEILLVGGGGGAGGKNGDYNGGGGGGGGVIHTNIAVTARDYPVVVGAGGPVNANGSHWNPSLACGGSTTGFDLTALGGGPGALGGGWGGLIDNLGASGGGGATDDSTTLGHGLIHGGTPLASTENGNLGHAGADAVTNNDGPRFNSGGGGGAGAAATNYNGGDGYPCDITGTTVYYGGGGRGGKRYGGGTTPQAGKGGGKANFGGGGDGAYGSGNPETGGPGVVIVSYTRSERETTGNFTITGWEANGYRGSQPERYAHIVITNETTLHVTGSASLEVLLVGGGGGSGGYLAGYYGGGGGGGGVVHAHNLPVSAGDYTIAIGAGGPVNVSYSDATTCMAGGSTTAFGFTAFGGGPGAQGGGYGSAINNIGASGGGGARNDNGGYVKAGGTAKSLLYNIGHNGADSVNFSNPGGGGGAGAAGSGSNGGDGYLCNITGVAAYYAGGGSGGSGTVGLGGGVASFGGGGSSGTTSTSAQTGGKGVVIIRYKKPKAGMVIVLQ